MAKRARELVGKKLLAVNGAEMEVRGIDKGGNVELLANGRLTVLKPEELMDIVDKGQWRPAEEKIEKARKFIEANVGKAFTIPGNNFPRHAEIARTPDGYLMVRITGINGMSFWFNVDDRFMREHAWDIANGKWKPYEGEIESVGELPGSVISKGSSHAIVAGEAEPKPVGKGPFGNIYDQFKGKAREAVDFLTKERSGEAVGALHHKDVGDIDLVWGKEGTGRSDGYGLAKLLKYHPEVLDNLQEILDDMHVVSRTDNRINLESDTHQAAVRLTWDKERKTWLLTAFEKKSSVPDNTTDTAETPEGKRNDTATPQNATSSADKVTENSGTSKGKGKKNDAELVKTEQELRERAGKKVEGAKLPGEKAARIDLGNFTAAEELRNFLTGVYYKDGYIYATDGKRAIKIHADYPKEYEGRMVNPRTGKFLEADKYVDLDRAMDSLIKGGVTKVRNEDVAAAVETAKELLKGRSKKGHPIWRVAVALPGRTSGDSRRGHGYAHDRMYVNADYLASVADVMRNSDNFELYTTDSGVVYTADGVRGVIMPLNEEGVFDDVVVQDGKVYADRWTLEKVDKRIADLHKEHERLAGARAVREDELKNNSSGHSISTVQYKGKNGRMRKMCLITPLGGGEFGSELQEWFDARAKEMGGWYDTERGGVMVRSMHDASKLSDMIENIGADMRLHPKEYEGLDKRLASTQKEIDKWEDFRKNARSLGELVEQNTKAAREEEEKSAAKAAEWAEKNTGKTFTDKRNGDTFTIKKVEDGNVEWVAKTTLPNGKSRSVRRVEDAGFVAVRVMDGDFGEDAMRSLEEHLGGAGGDWLDGQRKKQSDAALEENAQKRQAAKEKAAETREKNKRKALQERIRKMEEQARKAREEADKASEEEDGGDVPFSVEERKAKKAEREKVERLSAGLEETLTRLNVPRVVCRSAEEMVSAYRELTGREMSLEQARRSNAFVDKVDGEDVVFFNAETLANGRTAEAAAARGREITAHEVLGHYGLPVLMGEEGHKRFCGQVYGSMSEAARERFNAYYFDNNLNRGLHGDILRRLGLGADTRWEELTAEQKSRVLGELGDRMTKGAADEYVAHLAERVERGEVLPKEEKTLWDSIVDMVRRLLGFDVDDGTFGDRDIAKAIMDSKRNLEDRARLDDIETEIEEARERGDRKAERRLTKERDAIERNMENRRASVEREMGHRDKLAQARENHDVFGEARAVADMEAERRGRRGGDVMFSREDEREFAERGRAIEAIEPTVVERPPKDREEAREIYSGIGKVRNKADGREVEFYKGILGKLPYERGLFFKAIPGLKDSFANSVLAYSERDNRAGEKRPDGTLHKAHPNIEEYHNYVGKVRMDGKDYYTRFTVTEEKGRERNGLHSAFVSSIDLYEKGTTPATMTDLQTLQGKHREGVVDAKLREFFERARKAGEKVSSEGENSGDLSNSISKNFSDLDDREGVRFSVVDRDEGKSLVGVHNISEEKLRKALKLGGFANPSVAVIDARKFNHDGFGEISLITPPELIDSRTGRNAGTWLGDAWTPTFPEIERQVSEKGERKIREDLQSLPEEMRSSVNSAIYMWRKGSEESTRNWLSYLFLKERGEAPELAHSRGNREADAHETLDKAAEYVRENGLEKEFDEWMDSLEDRYDARKVIFDGFTPSGRRRYIPATLENVSRWMKKQGGAGGAVGFRVLWQRDCDKTQKAHKDRRYKKREA